MLVDLRGRASNHSYRSARNCARRDRAVGSPDSDRDRLARSQYPARRPDREAFGEALGAEFLEREVRDFMTPGCLAISEEASMAQAAEALAARPIHAVLVVGARNGTPLGWVTTRGLLGWVGRDHSLARASDAITEQVIAIHPTARWRVARYALSLAGTTRLLVRSKPNVAAEGVLTDFDLAVATGR